MIEKILNRKKEGVLSEGTEFHGKIQGTHLSDEEKFNNILNFAKRILDTKHIEGSKEHPIFDLVRIIGRGVQSDYMRYLIYYDCKEGSHDVPSLGWDTVGFNSNTNFIDDNGELICFYNLKKEVKCNKKLNLSKDLILPWPWKNERLFNTITNIGDGRKWGSWEQDFNNHYVEVWLPMGIAWVHGGNHSIAIGIIHGGKLEPKYYYDISEVYKHITCDGNYYRRVKTNYLVNQNIIEPVRSVEFAALFEIGRLLVERGISFVN